MKVPFFKINEIPEEKLKFAVIAARYQGKWVFCKHRKRETYECPGGHREKGETIGEAAHRELFEETGAKEYSLHPISVYSVLDEKIKTYGMLYFAEVREFDPLPPFEIEQIEFFEEFLFGWTYPNIQPLLLQKVIDYMEKEL